MERQREQIDRVFENIINKKLNQDNIESFIRQFDSQFDQYCDQKEDQLRQSVESMVDEMVRLIYQYKQTQSTKIQSNNNQQSIITINSIKQNYEQIINNTQYIIKQQQNIYDQMMMKHDGRLEQIQQLQECENWVYIDQYSELDDFKKQIESYQQDNKKYQIVVDFYSSSCMDSIDSKIGVIDMIDIVDANSNVTKLDIEVSSSYHEWNSEIVTLITNRYTNVYCIYVGDRNDQVDDQMHGWIKQYIQQQPIIKFELYFRGSLHKNNNGYELIKQYNQLIKQKQYLQYLGYRHDRIGGWKIVDTKQGIKQLIDEVNKS